MKKHIPILFILFILCLLLVSCGDRNLPEDYVVVNYKILAVKTTPSDAKPGDTVRLRLLVSGKDMDQNSTVTVHWTAGGIPFDAPYNTEAQITVPSDILGGQPSMDIPVTAEITLDGKQLSALKRFRVIQDPVAQNPEITGIQADFISGGTHQTRTIHQGDTIPVDGSGKAVAFTSLMNTLPSGANDKLIYSWYMTLSSTTDCQLRVYDNTDTIDELLGQGAMAAEFRPSVVYSLYGKKAEEGYQKGRYNIYLVVRDNASESSDSSQDRLGTDFIYFTLDVQ